jgi:flagellar basal body-associated protein FliL
MTKKNKNNSGKLLFILLLLITIAAAGGGFFAYTTFIADQGPDKEMERLETIEKEYPKQKKIVIAEKKLWGKTLKNLKTTIENLEKNIRNLYVAYSVNSEKGAELLESQSTDLLASVTEVLETSKSQTLRLKNAEEKSFIDKIKEKISK